MKNQPVHFAKGYTIVELMTTMVITAVLAVLCGVYFANLLSIQEREREEAYIREKLVDACGAYADFLSIGSTVSTGIVASNSEIMVAYRQETGGVSLETGLVTRVAYLSALTNPTNRTMDMNVSGFENGCLVQKLSRRASGDAPLIPLVGDMTSCQLIPLNYSNSFDNAGFRTTDAPLGYLLLTAHYRVKNDEGEWEQKTATAERVVRLWNHE